MQNLSLNINYQIWQKQELSKEDNFLIDQAIKAIKSSYNPYSHFGVGCALRLEDGQIVLGANQENIAYPSGLCAERVALFGSQMYNSDIVSIAIASQNDKGQFSTAYPCGACRQVIQQIWQKQNQKPIKLLVLRQDLSVLILNNIEDLLPFSFEF